MKLSAELLKVLKLSAQKPVRQARKRNEEAIETWKRCNWPRIKKTRRLKASLVFWDESGFLMLPIPARTWAPRGQTPLLAHNAKRLQKVLALGMITVSAQRRRLGSYHLLQPNESIVVAVLQQMQRHFRRPLVVVWDRLSAHRSAWVREFLRTHPDVHVEEFPAYAPELNPVEYPGLTARRMTWLSSAPTTSTNS